ncbi:MAG: hypothetical protein ACM3N5_03400 [Candidatus Eiseniibacteriota bacterium]
MAKPTNGSIRPGKEPDWLPKKPLRDEEPKPKRDRPSVPHNEPPHEPPPAA